MAVNRIAQPFVQTGGNQPVPAGQGQGVKRPLPESADNSQTNKKAKPAQSGEMQSIARSVFDAEAGPAISKPTERKSLGQRQREILVSKRREAAQRRLQKNRMDSPSRRALQASSGVFLGNETDPDDDARQHAGAEALDTLRRFGRNGLQAEMERKGYDALQKYVVVSNAEQQLGKMEGLSLKEKKSLGVRLVDERAALIARERTPILASLNDRPERVVPTVMGENGPRPASRMEMRAMLGGTKPGGADIPLEPLTAGRVLRERTGDRYYKATLQSLRVNLMTFLRSYAPSSNSPKMYLARKDSAALTQLETAYDGASDLRHKVADQAGVLPTMSTAAMSFVFLGIAQSGKGKAFDMATQLYNVKDVDIDTRARVATLVYEAIDKIPDQLWGYDHQRRADVLAELKTNSYRIFNDMPSGPTLAERKENDIVRQLQSTRIETVAEASDKPRTALPESGGRLFKASPMAATAY